MFEIKAVSLALLATGLTTLSSLAFGAEPAAQHEQTGQQIHWVSFGPQLLTEGELAGYRARIRNAKTPEQRAVIREERYRLMKARAKEKGITPPEMRSAAGWGSGTVFGPDQMTEEGRAAFRAKMRGAKAREIPEVEHADQRKHADPYQEVQVRETGVNRPEAPAAKGAASGGTITAIFAPPLMTEAEQKAFRARLRAAKSPEERERIRAEHRRELHARAKERGIVLP